jgi:hypothetical protein
MHARRSAFEAWLIRQAMRRTFTEDQVADLRIAFSAGWYARIDVEAVAMIAVEPPDQAKS